MEQQHFSIQKVCPVTGKTIPDGPLLHDTVFNNIKAGRPDATEWEVLQAADEARVLDFTWNWPEGMYTRIGDGGVTLSYAEELCVRIARSLLVLNKVVLIQDQLNSIEEDEEDLSVSDLVIELINKGVVEVVTKKIITFFWHGYKAVEALLTRQRSFS